MTNPNNDQTNLIDHIYFVNKIFTQYALGMALALGNIGSILNCLVFFQANLRKSPCSMYFIASSVSQLMTFNFALLTRMLNFGYGIRTYNTFDWFCRIRFYITFTFVAMPRYFMILALIDRYVASSRDAVRRQWSTPAIARRLIAGNTLLWFLMYSHVLVCYTNQSGSCSPQSDTYNLILTIQYSIDSGFLPLMFMVIFGWWTLKNIRAIGRHIRPMGATNLAMNLSRKDLQLIKVLTNQVVFFVILNIPYLVFAAYQLVTLALMRSPFRIAVELLVNNIVHCLVYIEYSFTFVINIATSPLFRSEFKYFLQKKLLLRRETLVTATMIAASSRVR